jgi:hypothetical protein
MHAFPLGLSQGIVSFTLANNGYLLKAYSLDIDMPSFLKSLKVQDRARSWNETVHASDVRCEKNDEFESL